MAWSPGLRADTRGRACYPPPSALPSAARAAPEHARTAAAAADDRTRTAHRERAQRDRGRPAGTDLPVITPGDTVKVSAKVVEGNHERIQVFEGLVMRVRNAGVASAITVRRIASGVGVERTFKLHSPRIEKIEVVRHGQVRRAKLYFLASASARPQRRSASAASRGAGRTGPARRAPRPPVAFRGVVQFPSQRDARPAPLQVDGPATERERAAADEHAPVLRLEHLDPPGSPDGAPGSRHTAPRSAHSRAASQQPRR